MSGSRKPRNGRTEVTIFDVAAGALLERVENPTTTVKRLRLQPRLIVRESTLP